MEIYNDISRMKVSEIRELINGIERDGENYTNEINKLIDILNLDSRKSVRQLSQKLFKVKENYINELKRVKQMYNFDKSFGEYRYIAGVDEVGRGPLAGPIVSAAVILDLNTVKNSDLLLYINDSKKINKKRRENLSNEIRKKALCYSIEEIDNNIIDQKGISWSNNQVFISAIEKLNIKPDFVLSDGYAIKDCKYINEGVVKGDTKSASIACASILAKVYRDNIMLKYSQTYPQYDFENNVGYGTQKHISAINKYGISSIHRKSFLTNILK